MSAETARRPCSVSWPSIANSQYWFCDREQGHDGDHQAYWSGTTRVRASMRLSAAARGDSGHAAVAWLVTVVACAGLGWLATVYLSLAAVLGFFAACGVSFVLGALTCAAWQADQRLYGWDDAEPVPYRLVDEVAARRDTHARRTA